MTKYRLYIDEAGHHRYTTSTSVAEQYLCLCGIIIEAKAYEKQLIPRLEKIRALFYNDPDFKPPLHLADIVKAKGVFKILQDAKVRTAYNQMVEEMIANVDFTIVAVVIDKTAHNQRYYTPEHPYHYCMMVLLERYCKFLDQKKSQGDVLAEARGRKEDAKLKEVYTGFYENGSTYIAASQAQNALTSKDIKIKAKSQLVAGLEFADLLANNANYDVLLAHKKVITLPSPYTQHIINTIQPKYFTGASGIVKGNGKKLL